MIVTMMDIRMVRVLVSDRGMLVRVRMGRRGDVSRMVVKMVPVQVIMKVLVFEFMVLVPVRVFFAEQQISAEDYKR